MKSKRWHSRSICNNDECRYHTSMYMSNLLSECCPECGSIGWHNKIGRWKSTVIWNKPSTWFSGVWEFK